MKEIYLLKHSIKVHKFHICNIKRLLLEQLSLLFLNFQNIEILLNSLQYHKLSLRIYKSRLENLAR